MANTTYYSAFSLKAGVESKVPTIIQTGYNSAVDQVDINDKVRRTFGQNSQSLNISLA